MDLTPIVTPLLQIVVTLFVTVVLPRLAFLALRWLKLQNNAVAQAAASDIAKMAAGQMYRAMVVINGSVTNVNLRNHFMAQAIQWAIKEAPNAAAIMKAAGWDAGHMSDWINGHFGAMLAIDPNAAVAPLVPVTSTLGVTEEVKSSMSEADVASVAKSVASALSEGSAIANKLGAALLVLMVFGLTACATPGPVPAQSTTSTTIMVAPPSGVPTPVDTTTKATAIATTFKAIQAKAPSVIATIRAAATTAVDAGLIPPQDVSAVQLGVAALDAANASLLDPGSTDPRIIARSISSAVDDVVRLLPNVSPNTKLSVDLLSGLVNAYLTFMPISAVTPGHV